MLDFLMINEEKKFDKKINAFTVCIRPEFRVRASEDLMIRGRDFYAIWDDETKFWSKSEDSALNLIDKEIKRYSDEYKEKHPDENVIPLYTYKSSSGIIDLWHKYVQKQMRDNYHNLDETIIFSGEETKRTNYASKHLTYALEKGCCDAYNKLMGTLYSEEERHKIEWAIGAVITGDSKKIQKFLVLYGPGGTGKSTVLNIIMLLFDGYYGIFDAKALGSATNVFALDSFRDNPLVAIQHDGDLSRIEDNTRLNSVISHEKMQINEKFKSTYETVINSFLFMGTNKPVRITDAKSGIIRRLIDVSPTGKVLPMKQYTALMSQIKFELGAIAYHCKNVYLENPNYYDDYVPFNMIGATNDIYNFIEDNYIEFKKAPYVTLSNAYQLYSNWCKEANIPYPYKKSSFKEELKNYFDEFKERTRIDDQQIWNAYIGLNTNKFVRKKSEEKTTWLEFKEQKSLFDDTGKDYISQYANEDGTPLLKWENVRTHLKDIDTSRLHYVKVPENHIVIDFDIKKDGEKNFELNYEAALNFPQTYAELSKSGKGIHLHYIYDGDVAQLSRVYANDIEVKVFSGNSSLRRKLTKCNDIPIRTINSGLPLRNGGKKMIDWEGLKTEKQLRTMILKNLKKEYHDATKPSVDYIYSLLEEAYESDLNYDVTDLRSKILYFASNSTNNAKYCINLVDKMHFKCKELEKNDEKDDNPIIFYDVEVFPNLFIINWKYEGTDQCVRMINPEPNAVKELCKNSRLIGFNNRRYDNHILYGRMIGYSNFELFNLSRQIIEGKSKNCFFGQAYNLSYTDVYDFCSKKQSLKKWEIELGIHHQELGLPWDKDVPEELWGKVAEYCDNDVFATEAVFKNRYEDFVAREILSDISGGSVNDTTNSLTGKLIFGDNKSPQSSFQYRNLAEPVYDIPDDMNDFLEKNYPLMMKEYHGADSYLPYFPGYSFENGVSNYKNCEVGEGGRVEGVPGMYVNVKVFDVESMHPNSACAEYAFGPYTQNFYDLLQARLCIKHKRYDDAKALFGGKLSRYLDDPSKAKGLARALKIAINAVYGQTTASYDNLFRDVRNKDNFIAKRGALFMINLAEEVRYRGGEVVHIKTDSIKIVNPTKEIEEFVYAYGKRYGYNFAVEHIFEKFCLVNDAVYIAKCAKDDPETPGEWTATGLQFQIPYVFKKLFSHEDIKLEDMTETKSVSTALYLNMNEKNPEEDHYTFVGKVGLFCPIKPGKGGGLLMREKDGKYSYATGAKGYRWLEFESVKGICEDAIDESYFMKKVDEAIDTISKYGDFEWFSS